MPYASAGTLLDISGTPSRVAIRFKGLQSSTNPFRGTDAGTSWCGHGLTLHDGSA